MLESNTNIILKKLIQKSNTVTICKQTVEVYFSVKLIFTVYVKLTQKTELFYSFILKFTF